MSTWYHNDTEELLYGLGDSLSLMRTLDAESIDLILTDPPWNTGRTQETHDNQYEDSFVDFRAFLVPRIQEMHRLLSPSGTLILHMGPKEAHNVKIWLDEVFGEKNFYGEIITYSELGRGSGSCVWTTRHSYIYIYSKRVGKNFVNASELPPVERKAPKKGAEKYDGDTKKAFSVLPWTMSNSDPQRLGYPSQKHVGLYQALLKVHCLPGGLVLDPFAGSGTTGEAALSHACSVILLDKNPQSLQVNTKRFGLRPS